jgi:uncharacterized protein Yka (UPF0111/DUF47 family)
MDTPKITTEDRLHCVFCHRPMSETAFLRRKVAKIILMQCQELQKAVSLMQKNGNILIHCVEINRLENEADLVSQQAIAKLFESEKDPINLIKVKELLEFLERATDKAEDVANVLETVVLKNT